MGIERVEWRPGRIRAMQSAAVHVTAALGAVSVLSRWPAVGCASLLLVLASAAWDLEQWRRARHIVRLLAPTADGLRVDGEDLRIRSAWLGPHATSFRVVPARGRGRLLWIYRDEVDAACYAMLRRLAKSAGSGAAQPATGRSTSRGSAKLG